MADPKPVLLLAQSYPPENTIGALRPHRFARYLNCFGYEAHIVTASPQPPNAPPNVHYAAHHLTRAKRLLNLAFISCEYEVTWWLTALRAAEELVRTLRPAAVISTSPPATLHMAASILKRRYGLPWIADFRDPLRGNFGRTRQHTMAIYSVLEKWLFSHADALIATTDATARHWKRLHPAVRDKIDVIYNGFDEDLALQAEPLPPRDHRVMTYAGTLYDCPYAIAVLRALVRLCGNGGPSPGSVSMRMIGSVGDPAFLRDETVRRSMQDGILACTPQRIALAEARAAMTQSDYLLLLDPYRNGGSLQLPAKIFDYIEIGRPILAFTTPGAPSESVLRVSGIPHVCIYRGDSEPEIDRKLRSFLELPSDPAPASARYRHDFSARQQTAQLAAILDRVQGTGHEQP